MTEAAQTGALLRHAVRVKGINLDHPAEAVGFVAVVLGGIGAGAGGVEADEFIATAFGQCPAVAAVVGADAVMGVLPGNGLVTIAEITGPVLLGGHVGVPGGDTHGTVVQGTPGGQALRAVLGLTRSLPRTGPCSSMGVRPVMRRLYSLCTSSQRLSARFLTCATDTPWALISLSA